MEGIPLQEVKESVIGSSRRAEIEIAFVSFMERAEMTVSGPLPLTQQPIALSLIQSFSSLALPHSAPLPCHLTTSKHSTVFFINYNKIELMGRDYQPKDS